MAEQVGRLSLRAFGAESSERRDQADGRARRLWIGYPMGHAKLLKLQLQLAGVRKLSESGEKDYRGKSPFGGSGRTRVPFQA